MEYHHQLSLLPGVEPWYVLSMDAPYPDLLLRGLKIIETRPKGVTSKLPIRLFIHVTQRKMCPAYKALADKYLGSDYKPQHGHIIGVGVLTKILTMDEALMAKQPQREIDLGRWSIGRKAWYLESKERLSIPVPATGCQAAPWSVDDSPLYPGLRQ